MHSSPSTAARPRIEMYPHYLLLFLLVLLPCSLTASHGASPDDRLLKSSLLTRNGSDTYFEVTRPLPTEHQTPSCSLTLLRHNFSNTIGSPPVSAEYSPPKNCSAPWSAVVLDFAASCRGEQYDRIAAVWIDGVEILRTSTAEPTDEGIFWKVSKDVTRYASVLSRPNSTVSVMLENVVNDYYTGVYHVNITLNFYGEKGLRVSEEDEFELSKKLGFLHEKSAQFGFWEEESVDLGRKLGLISRSGVEECREEESLHLSSEGPLDLVEEDEKIGLLSEETASASLMTGEENVQHGLSKKELPLVNSLRLKSEDLGLMDKREKANRLYGKPADLIIPISSKGRKGFWFQIKNESDVHSKEIQIPVNTYRAVLEIYVSFHLNDEFWYSNLPDSYIQQKNLTTGRGNGAFREVFAAVDGLYVGSVLPFPVVFTGGINPLFWEPVVGIGAFDLPSYDLDLTPFLGKLLDGKNHTFSLGVTDAISYWLVDANLHLWLDHSSPQVAAKLVRYRAPNLSIRRKSKVGLLDGKFKIKAEREAHFAGWVNSSFGNFTTHVKHELKFKNTINVKNNGNFKVVGQKIKSNSKITLEAFSELILAKAVYRNKYPLHLTTQTQPGENKTYLSTNKFSNGMNEQSSVILPWGISFSSLINTQESEGSMLVQDHSVLSGVASTVQNYTYKDDKGCYNRICDC
ncbi:peptide-N4-N-acetyl-beta-glucosaminylasparagine amidase A-like protein [Cinnamomum micranthum f. kanehirae]|uniref:Peptide-N4-N-acetyl-beta-glucosaminylasparagine amidase A-like protein n=1 Tax=Cinnamomum micranthum f. kanehirae TaxID=337451 RepID=A0A443NK76_9MAGN|nr:peptide-N4-N-acetyl-beta-glucosaminylasparagine amidase A-like protein [Cinnamomum micranthum f. kanehirae]